MGLSDQEVELIAQRIVTDLTGGGSAPAGAGSTPAPLRDIGIFDTIDEAVKASSVAYCQFEELGL